ncbi:unnamed protein product [Allacma fusca]|uniref:C2H2-type domain-containing protein n=1 Tax=Allacma fusca TaxID=39272 RepID=A0A8J2M908_9HEXA|nr:unnamed protein product [Allacma fusca]
MDPIDPIPPPCPICKNYTGEDPIEVHLLTHSKESLVLTLLQLKQTPGKNVDTCPKLLDVIVTSEPSTSTDIEVEVEDVAESTEIEFISEEIEIDLNNSSCGLERSTSPGSSKEGISSTVEDRFTESREVVQIKVGKKEIPPQANFSGIGDPVIETPKKVDVFIVSATRLENNVVIDGMDNRNELTDNVCTVLQTGSSSIPQDCRDGDQFLLTEFPGHPHTSKTWTMAQIYPDDINLATAIKCIIDESDNRSSSVNKEKNLIYLDGRYIPVYSSITELHCSDDFNPPSPVADTNGKAAFVESTSIESDSSNLDVDLMTDEEIPPKGEISEFEESSTSLMSDDSNLKPAVLNSSLKTLNTSGRFPGRQISLSFGDVDEEPLVNSCLQAPPEVTTPSVGSSVSKAEQFICFDECQNHKSPKQFSSLFEMIQHKSGTHANNFKKDAVAPVNASPSDEVDEQQILARDNLEAAAVEKDRISEPVPQANVLQRKNYFCLYCDFTSPLKSTLATHMKEEHPDRSINPEIFECATCGKIFENRASLRKHLLVHREKPFVCSICSKGFPSSYKLMEHTRVHTGYYPYKCSHCGKAYRTPSLLSTHEKRIHPPTEPERIVPKKVELMCGICHRIMHSKRNLESHLLLHKQEKPQKCPHCSETFPRPSVLVRHIRAVHDPLHSSRKTKDCAICGKLYHPNSMKSHMLIHRKEKPHKCLVCHKNFRTLGNLNNHTWSHTSAERPYKCQICPKSYIFLKNLQNHTIVHKRKTLHFVCNECGVKFTNKFNLKRHVEEHTAEKKFKCLICGKKFFRHYYLVDHVRIHSGSRPYTCTICGKASSTKSNHVAHLKIHDARESGNLEG